MNNIIKSLSNLNIVLPEPAKPVANYSPLCYFREYNICIRTNSF